jgi:hypothetical protein
MPEGSSLRERGGDRCTTGLVRRVNFAPRDGPRLFEEA